MLQSKIKRIIKEELNAVIREAFYDDRVFGPKVIEADKKLNALFLELLHSGMSIPQIDVRVKFVLQNFETNVRKDRDLNKLETRNVAYANMVGRVDANRDERLKIDAADRDAANPTTRVMSAADWKAASDSGDPRFAPDPKTGWKPPFSRDP